MDLKERAQRLKYDISAVFLALKDRNTPWYAKIFATITVCYGLSPVDLIPDFIPMFGYLDDVIILPLLVALTIKFIPNEIMVVCRERAEGMWESGTPKNWYYSIPIILFWILVVFMLLVILRNI